MKSSKPPDILPDEVTAAIVKQKSRAAYMHRGIRNKGVAAAKGSRARYIKKSRGTNPMIGPEPVIRVC